MDRNVKFKKAMTYFEKGEKMHEMEEPRLALSSIRNSLEILVKQMCSLSGITFDTREISMDEMINQLFISNVIDERELDLMHRIRKNSNQGDHVELDEDEISLDSSKEAIEHMKELLSMVQGTDYGEKTSKAMKSNNTPMKNPDYYSRNRRYYGKWSHCMTKESLQTIPEYIELYNKAKENEDIEAMLNLAVGFLPNEITWNSEGLVNMPPIRFNGQFYYNEKSYDDRYYYWIAEAVTTAIKLADEGVEFPQKYIATAIWEAAVYFVYAFCLETVNTDYVEDVEMVFNPLKDRKQSIKKYSSPLHLTFDMQLEGVRPNGFDAIMDLAESRLLEIIFTNSDDIISHVQSQAAPETINKISFLSYCNKARDTYKSYFYGKPTVTDIDAARIKRDYVKLTGKSEDDIDNLLVVGENLEWNVLEQFCSNDFCNHWFHLVKDSQRIDDNSSEEKKAKRTSQVVSISKAIGEFCAPMGTGGVLTPESLAIMIEEKAEQLDIPARAEVGTASGGLFGPTYPCVIVSHPNPPCSYFKQWLIFDGDTVSFKYGGLSKGHKLEAVKNNLRYSGHLTGLLASAVVSDGAMERQQENLWHTELLEDVYSAIWYGDE